MAHLHKEDDAILLTNYLDNLTWILLLLIEWTFVKKMFIHFRSPIKYL